MSRQPVNPFARDEEHIAAERRAHKLYSVIVGSAGHAPEPMSAEDRIAAYAKQNGARSLTPAQMRRIRKQAKRQLARDANAAAFEQFKEGLAHGQEAQEGQEQPDA